MRELAIDPGLLDETFESTLGEGLDPDWLRSELIKDAVEDLPDSERAVVELLIWGQMTKVEVAAELGRSRQSIHDVWVRAQARLRGALRDL